MSKTEPLEIKQLKEKLNCCPVCKTTEIDVERNSGNDFNPNVIACTKCPMELRHVRVPLNEMKDIWNNLAYTK